ncbi:MAG: purine-nucleoside phosphorylase [Kiritimatiellae bacterium]|nr:purine-nucleoside phosphorylase [Kiritimatiellia bacterium]
MDKGMFDRAAGYLPDVCFENPPDLGMVLGSGWSDALKADRTIVRIPYAGIPELGGATVAGHTGEFVLCERHGRKIAAWRGRRHWYEGVPWESVVMPVEILRRMGCQNLLLTNASGGINPVLRPGDFVIVRDHINMVGLNPLMGAHREEWGDRFPDMTEIYSKHFAELLHAGANRLDLRVMDGVYAYTSGPCYETPAEVQFYKAVGADVVGMSTVPEAIFAKACGFRIAGISLVSNLAAGISRRPLAHEEVVNAAQAAKEPMGALIDDFISRL